MHLGRRTRILWEAVGYRRGNTMLIRKFRTLEVVRPLFSLLRYSSAVGNFKLSKSLKFPFSICHDPTRAELQNMPPS